MCLRRVAMGADYLSLLVDDMVDKAGVLVRAVVILTPNVRREEVVEGRERQSRNLAGDLQPFGVLIEHRVDDVDEGFVAIEQPVAPCEEVALEPALAEVLRKDLHDTAIRGETFVRRLSLGDPGTARRLEDRAQSVRRRRRDKSRKLRGLFATMSRRNAPSARPR